MPSDYRFDGFSSPNYTQIPDEFFDVLAPRLTEPELRVLLYVMRRIIGFKKSADDISLKQIVEGITTRDGRVLDLGAGVSKPTAIKGLRGLVEKGIILAHRNRSSERGDEATTYTLRFKGQPPVSTPLTGGVNDVDPRGVNAVNPTRVNDINTPRVNGVYPQETVEQETEEQETVIPSKDSTATPDLDEAIDRVSRELGDLAHGKSNRTRAANLMVQYSVDEFTIARLVQAVLTETLRHGSQLQRPMAWFFGTLEDRLKTAPGAKRSLAGRYARFVRQ
jgi:hypothetical protein